MLLKEAQSQVDQWIKVHGVRYFNELTNMALLTEEVGEVARIIARRYGEQSEKESDKGKDLLRRWRMCCGCCYVSPTKQGLT
jgi:NTP pyrophosphatase (non-canonical NTP hydrolase)